MMMKIAGGPGMVSPIDFHERKKPVPRWMLAAIAGSVVAHGAAGVWLYQQKFVVAEAPTPPEGPIITVTMPRPKLPEPVLTKDPPAPTTPIHRPISTVPTSDTLVTNLPDTTTSEQPGTITVINPHGVPDATGDAVTNTPPEPPLVISNPNWTKRPTAEQLIRAYPDRALRDGVSGSASLRCTVRIDGTLTGCGVVSETPAGQGFGQAASELARHFRMSPRTVNGQPVEGARVTIPLRFNAPED